MDRKKKFISHVTNLLILKIQYERQHETLQQIVENEKWEDTNKLRSSADRSLSLLEKMRFNLEEIRNMLY